MSNLVKTIKTYSDGSIETVSETNPLPSNLYIIRNWTKDEVDESFAAYAFNSKPEVRPRFAAPSLASGTNRTQVVGWDNYFLAINYGDVLRDSYVKSDNKFCFNNAGFPAMESVDAAGNQLIVERIENGWAKIKTLKLSDGIPNPSMINYQLTPWFVHRLWIVTRDYRRIDVPNRGDCYYPVVQDGNEEAWMPLDWLVKL